jgi:hypothetical protein
MKAVCILFVAFAFAALAQPQPNWWSARGVIRPDVEPDDFAIANLGQVKQFARAAVLEFEAKLPGGAGVVLHQKVTAWDNPVEPPDDYAVVTHGQLKHLLDAFYARLESVRATMAPDWPPVVAPWAGGVTGLASAQNTAVANIGQVKNAFAGLEGDRASRSLVDSGALDPTTAGARFGLGWLRDSDGDGVSDLEELATGTDPLDASSHETGDLWLRVTIPMARF